jgi:uncharacterized OB-fold protein
VIERVSAPPRHGIIPVEADADSAPYWSALAENRLQLPRCSRCQHTWSPPSPRCPHCGAEEHGWRELDGHGRVYSWVVVHRPMDEAFAAEGPYTIAVVELDDADGARLVGRLLGPPEQPVTAGAAVRTVVYDVGGQSLPGFVADASSTTGSPTLQGTREGNPA